MRKLIVLLFSLCAAASPAFGHATSIGFENAGPGSVTVWLGTYQHGGHHTEGSLKLEGVMGNLFPATIVDFNQLTHTKPGGLVDGVTHWYVQHGGGINNLPLVDTEDSWLAVFPGLPTNHWQGVTFGGLSTGYYQFTWVPAPFPSQEWSPWSSQMNGIFDLTGVVVPPPPTGVPDGGTTGLLMASTLLLVGAVRRRLGA